MRLVQNDLYVADLKRMADSSLAWDLFNNSCILIAGATGLIGSCLIDLLMYMNEHYALNCYITALYRDKNNALKRFSEDYFTSKYFKGISHNICDPYPKVEKDEYSYIFHLASNTHPIAYSERPIDTILANVYGTRNLLDICADNHKSVFIFPSSVEIYGNNRGDVEFFNENYLGYINSNTLRAGYPESKRVCESLCQAYIKEMSVYAVIPRLPRVFGPTMKKGDSKALSQFINNAISGDDIVLKSEGNQHFSFLYITDALTGIMTIMLYGENGMAYNIADESCDGTLRETAEICASIGGGKVIFEVPDEIERQGYSTATKARLDGSIIKQLGWKPNYDLKAGIDRTINILRSIY